ncbi:MAG: hypothetical protein EXR37_02975, partial [Limnohabitans sp.]|nr:hypothetical protein [Limnohabitans sp.]
AEPLARVLLVQSEVVPQVMATWCIDQARIVFAGHSDGGSLATGLTVRTKNRSPAPAHAVISAAGITSDELNQEACPAPLHVTVLHNPEDQLFPGYGDGTVRWCRQCLQCSEEVNTEPTVCQVRQCMSGKRLRHCATAEPHHQWPDVTSHLPE